MSNGSGCVLETRAEIGLHCLVEWIVYKWLLLAPQVPCRSQSNDMALGIALSCPSISLLEAGAAMDLTLCRPVGLHMFHPPFCPERSPRGNLGNALGQGFGLVLPKTSQLGGAHGSDREGRGIYSPGHLTPPW